MSALALAGPATGTTTSIDIRAGSLSEAVFAIGRQTGASIAVRDAALLARRAPPIRGRMDAAAALALLARSSGLVVMKVGPNSFVLAAKRLTPARAVRKAVAQKPRRAPLPPTAPSARLHEPDIVVTASKRDTPLRRFSGQFTRIDGDDFKSLGVPGADAIEARSDGFSSTHLGAGRNKLFIRGIADSSFSGPTQSPVGQYLGDTRTGYSGPDPDLKIVDMQSVEILAGPQGTLYGSGALGGIILLKPHMPAFGETFGQAAAGISMTSRGDPGADLTGVLNAPLWSGGAVRLAGYAAREGGYVDNETTGQKDINDVSVVGGRAILTAELSPSILLDLSGTAQRIDGDDSQYADEDGPDLSRSSHVDQPFSSRFALASVTIRKDEGPIRFRSTTAVSRQNVREIFDASLPGRVRELHQASAARALSNETRVWRPMQDGYSWLAGVSSIVHKYHIGRHVSEAALDSGLGAATNRVRETTAYGEAGFELLPGVDASAGGRFTISRISGQGQHLSILANLRLAQEDAKRTEQRFLPTFSLLARPTDQLTLYARYQEGFRPGGLSIAHDTVRLYRNDWLGTAELGFRFGAPRRDELHVQGSATVSRWRDIQADYLDPSGLPVTDNIGDGRVWTLSANGGARLSDDLRFETGIAWNHGRITKPTPVFLALAGFGGGDIRAVLESSRMSIPNIARFVGRAALDWRQDLSPAWTVDANIYGRYVGRSRLGIGPHLGREQGRYFDTGAVVRLRNSGRTLSLSLTNLTNEVGDRFAFGAPIATGADQITPLRPRTIRLGLEQAF